MKKKDPMKGFTYEKKDPMKGFHMNVMEFFNYF